MLNFKHSLQDWKTFSHKMEFVEVIEITKSIEERNEEYTRIHKVHGSEEDNPYSMWSSYLAETISTVELDVLRVLWKPSKALCFQYDLNFSSSFLVMVIVEISVLCLLSADRS